MTQMSRIGGIGIIVCTDDAGIEKMNRSRLGEVEGFTLWKAFNDVDQDDFFGHILSGTAFSNRSTNITGTNDGDFHFFLQVISFYSRFGRNSKASGACLRSKESAVYPVLPIFSKN